MMTKLSWGRFAVALVCVLLVGRWLQAADAVWGPLDGGRPYLSGWHSVVVFLVGGVILGMKVWLVLTLGFSVFVVHVLNNLAWASLAAGRPAVYDDGRILTILVLLLLVMIFRKRAVADLKRDLARFWASPR